MSASRTDSSPASLTNFSRSWVQQSAENLLPPSWKKKDFRSRSNAHKNARFQTPFYRVACHIVRRSPTARRQERLRGKKPLFRDLLPIGSGHTDGPLNGVRRWPCVRSSNWSRPKLVYTVVIVSPTSRSRQPNWNCGLAFFSGLGSRRRSDAALFSPFPTKCTTENQSLQIRFNAPFLSRSSNSFSISPS